MLSDRELKQIKAALKVIDNSYRHNSSWHSLAKEITKNVYDLLDTYAEVMPGEQVKVEVKDVKEISNDSFSRSTTIYNLGGNGTEELHGGITKR